MARLPTKYDISPVGSLRSDRPMAQVDLGGEARGMQQAGAGLQNLGSSITQIGAQQAKQDRLIQGTQAETDLATDRAAREEALRNDTDYGTLTQRWAKDDGAAIQRAALRIKDPKTRELFTLEQQKSGLGYNKRLSAVADAGIKDGRIATLETAWQKSHDLIANPKTPDDVRTRTKTELDASIAEGAKAGVYSEQYANDLRRKYVDGADYALAGSLVKTPDGNRAVLPPQGGDLPAGMRNNNPGNIKYTSKAAFPGVVGPSQNTDQGDPQAVFATPEAGMHAAYTLALKKYKGGKTTANELIAGNMGWTPGNYQAAANIAKTAGLAPDQDLKLDTSDGAAKFMRALLIQEHGPKSGAYSDDMIKRAVSGDPADLAPQADGPDTLPDDPAPTEVSPQAAMDVGGHAPAPLVRYLARGKSAESVTKMQPALQQGLSAMFDAAPPEVKKYLSIFSGYRSAERQGQLWKAAVAKYGSEAEARNWVAPPGRSQHNHGNAADLAYDGAGTTSKLTPAGQAAMQWAHANAGKFGLAFPLANEPWHVEAAGTRGGGRQAAPSPPDNYATAYQNLRARFPNLSAEQIDNLATSAVTAKNGFAVQDRASVEQAVQDGPSALANTGRYDGQTLDRSKFLEVYGAEGDRRFNAYDAAMKTAKSTFDMQTQSAAEIMAQVEQARTAVQQTTGEGADLADKRLSALQTAAAATIKARENDPPAAAMQAFPAVKQAWEAVTANPGDQQAFANAIKVTSAAQEQWGLAAEKRRVLPGSIADDIVEKLKMKDLEPSKALATLGQAVFATNDPLQQEAIFDQLKKAGVPAEAEGAIRALHQGRTGDARFLMEAATAKDVPWGTGDEKPGAINDAIAAAMSSGSPAGVLYGLDAGSTDNLDRYQADRSLFTNAVKLKMLGGKNSTAAITEVQKALYGGARVVDQGHVKLTLPEGVDADKVVTGLGEQLPVVKTALEQWGMVTPAGASPAQKREAQFQSWDRAARINDIATNTGVWRNLGTGYGFMDATTGLFVAGKDGKPLVVTDDDLAAAAKVQANAVAVQEKAAAVEAAKPITAIPLGASGESIQLTPDEVKAANPAPTAPAPVAPPAIRPAATVSADVGAGAGLSQEQKLQMEAAQGRARKAPNGKWYVANPAFKDDQGNIVKGQSQWIEVKP